MVILPNIRHGLRWFAFVAFTFARARKIMRGADGLSLVLPTGLSSLCVKSLGESKKDMLGIAR